MTDLTSLTLTQAREALRKKEFSATELAEAHLAAVEQARALNAFVTEVPERARATARASDERLAKGEGGPLEGLPLAIKDLFCTKGVRTTACSHILDNFVPPYESTVTANLWRNGAVLIGKTNADEFAMGSSNETSYYGPVVSPWRRRGVQTKLVPGGSSGGSAAAVAARVCAGAIGTDTGGSIRQPAAFCGVVGLKPTYGRCSRWGIVAFASSLDQAGPLGRTVRDCAILLRAMAGHDPKDTTSADIVVPDYEATIGRSVKGMRIGIPKEYRVSGMPAEIEALWHKGADWLEEAGAELVEISLPMTKYALPAYYIVAPAEASSNLARYDRNVRAHPRRRVWQGSAPAYHDRHLRALRWLLRCLLSAGARSAHADQARFRDLFRRRCRGDPDADDAVGCFRHRRTRARRPDRDVSQRCVYGDSEYGRLARHLRARRPRQPRLAARTATYWPSICRRNVV